MVPIEELLNRRSDLSTFLVHLTKDGGGRSAADNLRSILSSQTLEARSALGWVDGLSESDRARLKVVCFSEAPLEHVYTLAADIPGRQVHLSRYGVVISKAVARERSVNPVWYVDMTPRSSWAIAKALDDLRDQATSTSAGALTHPVAQILPFVEPMGTWPSTRKEFSWEREWRRLGDMTFAKRDITVVLCPEDEISSFESLGYRAIDPTWSLERMVAALAASPKRRGLSVAV